MKNICLLLEGLSGLYYSNLWPGIVTAAKENNCNVVCFAGGALRMSPQNPYEAQRNVIYNHIDVTQFDGLIISGTLKNFTTEADFAKFMERFSGLPTVSLAPVLAHIPSLVVDNTSGIKSIITHLAQDHKCRKFAFIGGPKGNMDADERLELFRKYLNEYKLKCDEKLVLAGDFSRSGGYKAALELIKTGTDFDALVAANDETALGAMRAFLDNEIRVPEDVAVTGFDNIEESELTTPPLTTVRQPLREIGRTAVELLLAKMRGDTVPMRTTLQTPLVIRQSCGCFINPHHSLDDRTRTLSILHIPSNNIARLKEQLAETLYNFATMGITEGVLLDVDDLKELADSFFDEVTDTATNKFLPALNRIVRAAALGDDNEDILQWQKILVLIRKYTEGLNRIQKETGDNLLHEGYNLFGETAERLQAHKRLKAEQKAALMRSTGNAIANSFDFAGLADAVVKAFPTLGINDFYLSLYDRSTKNLLNSKPVFGLQRGKKSPPAADAFFPTKDLVPGGVGSAKKTNQAPYQIIVQPLHFKYEHLGMAVFKDGPLTGYIYDILGEHLSGALQGALLMKEIEEANKELKELREKEHLRLEAIQRELQIGRTIQESFLPEFMPVMPGWESRALFQPAREVSGDFYDAFKLEDGRAAFVIADVSGKDVGAALFMALIRSLIRSFAEHSLEGAANPLNAIELTNRYIVNHHHTAKGRFMYATMFFAIVDPKTGEVTYINAGHNHPALLRPEGKISRWLPPTGPAVGVGIGENLVYRQEKITLEPGEMLLLYTDGVTEAKNEKGEFLTQKRFAELLEMPYGSLDEVINRVQNTLKEHCAGAELYDDVTMMGIYRAQG